ncbi:DUF4082 domain-containing protein [Nocardioides donggukensis]|uniref:DUF4082 domain-containing protein n=1 Tax=Nocardioides donggukensis TaxID=2774019 RepID=UPI00191DE285|nr:DUF4082 domain-containing protein [Nocardioides donggukensis]
MAAATLVVPSLVAAPANAADPCGPSGNKIACENSKPGSPTSEWDDFYGAGDDSIQGFSTEISVNVGNRVDFKIDTDASQYSVTIYRLGYYGGMGARRIANVTPSASLPQNQPQCITDVSTELYDCGNWGVSASWNVPSTAVSGVYIARLHRPDTGGASHITFVVRDDASHSDLIFQTADTTWQAYNEYGGSNFYTGGANGRATKISYNRPVLTRGGIGGRDFFFANEYPMVRFLERNGYDVSYQSGIDTDRRGQLLTNHKTYLSVGHDEYWSGAQRANVEAARDAGVNLMFLAGNEMYWRTRYEPSADASNTPYRTIVSYKETWEQAKIDPSPQWTGTWRDPRYAPQGQGAGRPENELIGTMYMVNHDDLPVTVNADEGKLRLWRNTPLASLPAGATRQLAPHTIGYESNEDVDNGFRPPGLIRLSTTTGPTPQYLQDFGNNVAPGTTTHHLTMYRASSGALVFSAGSIQWTWGLDAVHDSDFAPEPADPRMQQAQVNLLADMDAQPTTLQSGLVAATKSTDTTGPTAVVNTPAAGAARPNGVQVTATGTASDVGGRVAGVEVSTDDGASWHPATGTTSWSYSYVQHGQGTVPLKVRAVDDSANIGPTATRNIAVSCPCSVFGSTVPETPSANDAGDYELGLRFAPTTDGFVDGVRFYKGPANTGTHTGTLWTTQGQALARATFTGETATGWQSVTFDTPVEVTAGTTYIVSYTAPQGGYAVQPWAFASKPTVAPPLAVAGGFESPPSGVFASAGRFPDRSSRNANYFVDVLFTTLGEAPLIGTQRSPLPGSTSVPLSTTVGAKFNKPASAVSVRLEDPNGNVVSGSSTYDAGPRTVTFTPSAPLDGFVTYTATLQGQDDQGNQVSEGKTWSFTTAKPPNAPGVCPCGLFDDSTMPQVIDSGDTSAVTLGMKFSADRNGSILGVTFYKAPANKGTHTGALWTTSGSLLAQGTFTGESTAGWQTLLFDEPVPITKNTQYVASYRTNVGHWSANMDQFRNAGLSRPPLQAPREAGAYTYGTGFPSNSSSHSYLVDVVYERGAPTIAVAAQDPAPGAVSVPRGTSIKIDFTEPIQSGYSMQVEHLTGSGATPIAGATSLAPSGSRLTFVPSAKLPADADIRVRVSGVTSTEGAALADQTWTFRTRTPDGVDSQTLFSDEVPQVSAATTDGSSVELGTAFTPAKNGTITSLRFFKGIGNNGTHVGSLWSSSGVRLATVNFTNETASGWQTAVLPSPVPVTAGTTYVVSYLAPQGHYAYTPAFFADGWSKGDLSAPATNNGRYLYGSGGFPTFSHNATNYFVDVVFAPDPPTVSIDSRNPSPGATDVPRSATPSVTFSAPIEDGWAMRIEAGGATVPGSATLSANGKKITFTPSSSLAADVEHTVTLTGVVSTEGAVLGTRTWTFRTEAGTSVMTSLFEGVTPATPAANDGSAVELGAAFTPSVNGSVTAIKFFKGTGNTGTHTGRLWSASGTLLTTVTFTDETATGWQTAQLPTAVPLTAGQTYVVSYHAPNGRYAVTGAYFSSPRTVGPLTAPANNNGRYRYGSGGVFPTSSWNASNYFVDVVFRHTP